MTRKDPKERLGFTYDDEGLIKTVDPSLLAVKCYVMAGMRMLIINKRQFKSISKSDIEAELKRMNVTLVVKIPPHMQTVIPIVPAVLVEKSAPLEIIRYIPPRFFARALQHFFSMEANGNANDNKKALAAICSNFARSSARNSVIVPDFGEISHRDFILYALSLDSSNALCYYNLSGESDVNVIEDDGVERSYTSQELLLQAIHKDSNLGLAYLSLVKSMPISMVPVSGSSSSLLGSSQTITLLNGKRMSKQDLAAIAMQLLPGNSEAVQILAENIPSDTNSHTFVQANGQPGKTMTRLELIQLAGTLRAAEKKEFEREHEIVLEKLKKDHEKSGSSRSSLGAVLAVSSLVLSSVMLEKRK